MKYMADEKKEPEESKKEEPKDAEKDLAETKDRLLRLAAEFDNYQKKTAKDIDNAKSVGKAELVKALLPAIDEFELALSSFNGSDGDKERAKGVELVFTNILATLKSAGLKEISAVGKYDPYKHEIIMAEKSKEPEGTILEVVRKGYTFNDMLIRPSSVIVSKGNVSEDKK